MSNTDDLQKMFEEGKTEEAESQVREEVLKSEQAYPVLEELYRTGVKQCLSTRSFVQPVHHHLETIREELQDPEAFCRSFSTLQEEIRLIHEQFEKVHAKHPHTEQSVTPSEWPVIYDLSQQYHNAHIDFEMRVVPLMANLHETLRNEVPSLFTPQKETTE